MSWVIQRRADAKYYNGYRKESWSSCVSAAVAFTTKKLALTEMEDRGWRLTSLEFVLLPVTRKVTTPRTRRRADELS